MTNFTERSMSQIGPPKTLQPEKLSNITKDHPKHKHTIIFFVRVSKKWFSQIKTMVALEKTVILEDASFDQKLRKSIFDSKSKLFESEQNQSSNFPELNSQ